MRKIPPLILAAIFARPVLAAPVTAVTPTPDGVQLTIGDGILRLQVFSDQAIRVTYAAAAPMPEMHSYSVIAAVAPDAAHDVRDSPTSVTLSTKTIHAQIDKATGAITFLDTHDHPLLTEQPDGRTIAPATQPGVAGTQIAQSFVLPPDEGIYGLGQHQQGVFNYRGHTQRLLQQNMEVGIPVILSSHGYMLLWDNPAVTNVAVGAATGTTRPAADKTPGPEGAGENVMRFSSETGKAVDYYFVYDGNPEASMKAYRHLTGEAPLMPEWLLGFWQCKQRYNTQQEVLDVAKQYRDLKLPIDGIIQDWRYWPDNTWGSHTFDKTRYPEPAAMTKQLHDEHFHVLISVWPKFDLGTPNIQQLENAGAMFDPVIPYVYPAGQGKWYDPFAAAGRELYWKQISGEIFSLGFDGWWLDAPEPELSGKWGEFRNFRTSAGPGATVFNAYPLMHSTGIYQGQRAQTGDKRVVILTRSAYAGQQRNSAITWSGDIGSSWQVLKNQVPAGLNFSMSGIPYWNTDIGGFGGVRNPADPRYAEIFSRWFEFGAFCPMFRVHGDAPNSGLGPGKEFWRFNEPTQAIWRKFVDLRYRLMPYTYSVAWDVTHNGAPFMHPLVMDFPTDPGVRDIGDQYLFGPALMVNPVTTQSATTRPVYLPAGTVWYDFWSGRAQQGGSTITADAPLDTLPLYVRAGSIIPTGPLIQYVGEKPEDPLTLFVFRGADGDFTLYEDEGDSYRYEKGQYATIPMSWNESARTLTIGERTGDFPGMLKSRTFNVVLVGDTQTPGNDSVKPDAVVAYTGQPVTIPLTAK